MAMDLFSLLESSLTPEKKLENAIRTDNITLIKEVLQSGLDVNARIQVHGGNTALHLAATDGKFTCIKTLLEYHANADQRNDFNHTPVVLAFRKGFSSCVGILLRNSLEWRDIETVWSQLAGAMTIWQTATDEMICILLKSTPDLMRARNNLIQNIFHLCKSKSFHKSLSVWLKTGNTLSNEQEASLTGEEHKDFVEWMQMYKKTPQTLQHFARLTIRRTFHAKCNVMYGAQQLPLPVTVKAELCFVGEY